MSPWIPFALSVILISAGLGGLYYYNDLETKKIKASLLKTNDFVMGLDKRVAILEDKLTKSDANADNAGSSITGKLINLENRLNTAEKSVAKNNKGMSWNSNRIGKQNTSMETLETSVNEMEDSVTEVSASVDTQKRTVSSNTIEIQALADKVGTSVSTVNGMDKRVSTNTQSIEAIDAHRGRLGSAIQKVQGDTARLLRLYQKDNPSAKRVH